GSTPATAAPANASARPKAMKFFICGYSFFRPHADGDWRLLTERRAGALGLPFYRPSSASRRP
ncbi:MAG TPA: hypothetical protein VE688_03675, partial [Gaiellaceae bacterium]|nr:hypothetical protein [Gaiellaceae bacterium]